MSADSSVYWSVDLLPAGLGFQYGRGGEGTNECIVIARLLRLKTRVTSEALVRQEANHVTKMAEHKIPQHSQRITLSLP